MPLPLVPFVGLTQRAIAGLGALFDRYRTALLLFFGSGDCPQVQFCRAEEGGPAILAAAGRLAPTDKPDLGYAICFPATTIVRIIAVQVLLG
jgi:hypothetical protein